MMRLGCAGEWSYGCCFRLLKISTVTLLLYINISSALGIEYRLKNAMGDAASFTRAIKRAHGPELVLSQLVCL